MFIREKKNKSGSISIQIIQKRSGKSYLIKTIGSSSDQQRLAQLKALGKQEIYRLEGQRGLFVFEQDALLESFIAQLQNAQITTIGPELVFGRIYDTIGFNAIEMELFRHLVIARLAFPLSKLKTIEYMYRYQGIRVEVDTVYRFLDKLNKDYKEQVEQINFKYTQKILNNNIGIVFYDMTTLYFEASDEDDLRKTGFSKDGKHSNPQIFLGLLVALGGYAIGYDIFEGNIFEGHTLIPIIEKLSKKFNLSKPIVVADAGLLSNKNITSLEQQGYQYILGARIKNESKTVQDKIVNTIFKDESYMVIDKEKSKLIVQYSSKRASKDEYNRVKGLQRLEKQIESGKLSKKNINNRGYNKFLKLEGDVLITIDKDKFEQDKKWNGLKGYLTNCSITPQEVMDNYRNLWQIEKAFRMSKTDLRIRPIYHRLRRRIEAHICLSFTAYAIYKELERILLLEKFELSVEKAAEITHNMYQASITLPESRHTKNILLKMDYQQTKLLQIIEKYC